MKKLAQDGRNIEKAKGIFKVIKWRMKALKALFLYV
jgi:hypothetical protein